MRIVIDYDRCQGNAQCVLALPDVFDLGDDFILQVLVPEQPDDRRRDLEEVARMCPTMAISFHESEGRAF